MITVTVSEARARMREMVAEAREGEDVHLTQHGEIVAVLVSPERLRAVRAGIKGTAQLLREARGADDVDLESGGISAEYAEELVRDIRADRDRG